VQVACPGGVCPPQAAPQQPAQPQFSKTPFDRAYAEAAFKQHGIAYNPKATDQQLYNLYVNKGSVQPGKKMTPFQTTVGARHNYLRPAPLQPTVARPRVLPSTDIDPPSLTPAPAPSPFKAAPRPATSVATGTPAKKPSHMQNPATLDAAGMKAWWDHSFKQQAIKQAAINARRQPTSLAAPAKPATPPKVR